MNTLLPQAGIWIMFSYSLFNLYNVLLFRFDLPFVIAWLLSANIVFFIVRIHRFLQNNQGFSQGELSGFILIALSFAAVALQYLNLQEYVGADGLQTLSNLRTEWVLSIFWLFAGGAVATFNVKESPTFAMIVIVVTGLAFLNGLDEQLMVNYYDVMDVGAVESISHLTLERHVIFLIILAYCLSPKTKWLVAFVGMFLLYSLQGRTAIIVFAICVIGMNVERRSLKNLVYIGVIGLLLIFSLRYAVVNQIIDTDSHRVKRMLLIGGVEEDDSVQARIHLLETNLQYLDDQFLFGDPTIFPEKIGSSGGYIHNILNAWQFYGFFVFACISLILLFSLRRMFILKSMNSSPKVIFGSFFLMYVTLSVIFSKGVTWDTLWFILGFWVFLPVTNTTRRRRRVRRESHRQYESQRQYEPHRQYESRRQ